MNDSFFFSNFIVEMAIKEQHIKITASTSQAINAQLAKGSFQTAEEVVQAGLELLELRQEKILLLKQALKEGEESSKVENYDRHEHLSSLLFFQKN